jgi:hypothetical protein
MDNEAMVAGSAGIFLILPQAENQPSLSALWTSLEALLQRLFPLLIVFFVTHGLLPATAYCNAKFSRFTIK